MSGVPPFKIYKQRKFFIPSTVPASTVLKIIKKTRHVEKRKIGGKCSVSRWMISNKKLLQMVTVRKTSSQNIFSVWFSPHGHFKVCGSPYSQDWGQGLNYLGDWLEFRRGSDSGLARRWHYKFISARQLFGRETFKNWELQRIFVYIYYINSHYIWS